MAPLPLLIDAGWRMALTGLALLAAALVLVTQGGLGPHGLGTALLAYSGIAVLVFLGLGQHAPHRRFGPANSVTLLRVAFAALLLGVLGERAPVAPVGRWAIVAAGTAALLLDGADGWAARKSGLESRFGARFDMESDALFVLALALLVYRTGQAGAWVLASGLMRYAFLVASWLYPPLAAPLPPSRLRKTICVLLIVSLLVALAPAVSPLPARLVCLASLLLVSYSFGIDCLYLTVRRLGRAAAVREASSAAP